MMMIKTLLVATTALTLAFAPAVAQTRGAAPARTTAPGATQPQDQVMSEPEMRDGLEAQGYTEIRIVQADGDLYQMTAEIDGKPVLLRVNARTGRYSERPAG
jgi:Peptidase propeptide and YPEB domain